tara:strand:+ start:151 stop:528 length:378 start_codon:yes stop_codon:yes gene_type:complete
MSNSENDENFVEKIKEVFESAFSSIGLEDYPKEALKPGTFVRSNRLDRLGFIVDAFYGELDKNNTKIIVYTIFMFPERNIFGSKSKGAGLGQVSNEYEYEITAYLMLKPVNIKEVLNDFGGGIYL